MADMLKVFVQKEFKEQLQKNYPHLQHPAGMLAQVKAITKIGSTSICTLKFLTRSGTPDDEIPEMPGIRTDIDISSGDTVAVLMLYGTDSAYIIGKAVQA